MPTRRGFRSVAVTALSALAALGAACAQTQAAEGIEKIDHILVIYMENRSFDNLYGLFPGANGLAQAGEMATQVDKDGKPYQTLPAVIDTTKKPPAADERFPMNMENKPFDIGKYVSLDEKTGDLVHRFYQEQLQIDGGKMDKFAAYSDAAGLVMGYYDASKTELWGYARKYTLADNFFHGAFGGSFLNHIYLVCVCAPKYPDAPKDMVAQLDDKGMLAKDGAITPDGYAVNTIQTSYQPHSAKITDPAKLLPPQEGVTIGDRLTEKGVSWVWYSGGWDDAIAGKPDALFQFHHQPFAYFKQFGDGTDARKEHLKDEKEMLAGIAAGELPAVAFWKPIGEENEHPGYANVSSGDQKVASVLKSLEGSKLWASTAVIITYDENGGSWDHVAPPKIDAWGPGTRVPALIISPFAKKGFVDHTQYDTSSILKLIEKRYGLQPLGTRDASANDMTNAFEF
ncbi:MAG TPA: acid phosphatase [Candidatus Acidoferrum sp.]|nr:acid phosphatase [Candidatus Acidoferrum sp.]